MMDKPIHRNKNTIRVLPDSNMLENTKPNNAAATQTAIDVVLRPNFSAKTADKGMNAAKHRVATS